MRQRLPPNARRTAASDSRRANLTSAMPEAFTHAITNNTPANPIDSQKRRTPPEAEAT
jgi:hypothetical protein